MVKKVKGTNIWPSRTYTIDEVAKLLSLSRTTVRSWIPQGLKVLSKNQPHLIIGAHLKDFLAHRVDARTTRFAGEDFVCMRCKCGRAPAGAMVDYSFSTSGAVKIMALCEACEGPISAFTSEAKLADLATRYELVLRPSTRVECSDETKSRTDQVGGYHARAK